MSLIDLCLEGDLEGVRAALERGADVNQKDGWGIALHLAVTCKNIEVLKLLLNVPNIDVNIVGDCGVSALHKALCTGSYEELKLLLNYPGINVNILSEFGRPLHDAVFQGQIEALKLLLNHPDWSPLTLNEKDAWGHTPVMAAVITRQLKCLAFLAADPRVDLDTSDDEGRSLELVAR